MSYFRMDHAGWIETSLKKKISPFGRKVAYIIGSAFRGIYNAPITPENVQWSRDNAIEVVMDDRGLSTFDSNCLTLLTLFAHELAVRVSISSVLIPSKLMFDKHGEYDGSKEMEPCRHSDDAVNADIFRSGLSIYFHQRTREGGISERHPTIEQAVEDFRSAFNETARKICDGTLEK